MNTIRLQLLFSPSSQPFKDLLAKGHSSFNNFVSLDASPVTGTFLGASGPPSDLVTEAFLDPIFVSQVRGLEAMLRVRERIRPAAVETDSHGLSSELAVAAGSGKIDEVLGKMSESACPVSSSG